jgi:branched-chain amino acid transport system permease protein
LQWGIFVGILTLLFLLPLLIGEFGIHLFNLLIIYIIAAMGLNILTGYAGQLSLGHAAFIAVGAYTAAILASRFSLPLIITIPSAGIVTGLVGTLFGIPSLRIKGFYLILTTLAAQVIILLVIERWSEVTGGTAGLIVPPPTLGSLALTSESSLYYLNMVMLLLTTFFAFNLTRTKAGRAFIAIRDNDLAAELLGINLTRYKMLAFFIGCVYAGVAGSLWGYWMGAINTAQFGLMVSVWFLGYIIIGGLGTIAGPFFGVFFVTMLMQGMSMASTRLFPDVPSLLPPLTDIVFGLVITLFLIFEPRGLVHRWHIAKTYYRMWPFAY